MDHRNAIVKPLPDEEGQQDKDEDDEHDIAPDPVSLIVFFYSIGAMRLHAAIL